MKHIPYLLALCIFLGCNKNEKAKDITVIDHSVKVEQLTSIEESLVDTMIFKRFSVIPLETNQDNLIREIDRISISNGRIYIFDNSLEKICIFDDKGKYINHIHSIGQGPEEYIAAIDFCLDEKNNELLLLCDRPYKLMRYSLDGNFIKETGFSDLYVEIATGSNFEFLFCLLNTSNEYEIACVDQLIQPVYERLIRRKKINKGCYDIGKSLVKSGSLIYARRFDPSLYYIFNDSIVKKYDFDFGGHRFSPDLPYKEDCIELYELCEKNGYIYSITNPIDSDKYILFKTNLCICLYDKENNKLSGYGILFNQSLNAGSNIYYPNQGNGNCIITTFDPSSLSYYSEEEIENNPLLTDLVQKVAPDDNPILIVYEFK